MELQGLEDIPDFWEIDLDEIEQDNVPIMSKKLFSTFGSNKVLTNHLAKGKFRQTSARPQAFSKPVPPPLLEELDCIPDAVKKLPNGNYEYASVVRSRISYYCCFRCNHSCKDKTKCRHLW
jgi:hypothetical protein